MLACDDTCLIAVALGLFILYFALIFKILRDRQVHKMENMRIVCYNCGANLLQPDICHNLYLDGKNKLFGRCPRCGAVGKFRAYE